MAINFTASDPENSNILEFQRNDTNPAANWCQISKDGVLTLNPNLGYNDTQNVIVIAFDGALFSNPWPIIIQVIYVPPVADKLMD